jgi:hypothetical protein
MLLKRFIRKSEFSTQPAETVTVNASLMSTAANDSDDLPVASKPVKVRRTRQRPISSVSHVGGWKVRMW